MQQPPEWPGWRGGRGLDIGWDERGSWGAPPAAAADPPQPPPWSTPESGGRRRRSLSLAAGLASFFLVGGVALAALTAFALLRVPADALSPMVPESSVLYVTAEIQPSGTQALTLSGLAAKFPVLSDTSTRARWVDSLLDDALNGSGLDASDVLPWLGPQIGLSVGSQALASGDSGGAYAVYVSTDDPSATQAALQKHQQAASTSEDGVTYSFSTQTYQGVTITAITESLDIFQSICSNLGEGSCPSPSPSSTSDLVSDGAYAIVGNALELAGSTSYLEQIIDTEQERSSSIESSPDYQRVLGQLPADRLGLFFMDYPGLVSMLQGDASALQGEGASLQPELQALQAYQGMGVSVAAESDGLAIDAVTDYDPGQLSADQQAMLGAAPDQNAAAGLTPAGVVAFYGFTGVQYMVRELVDELESVSPDVGSFLNQSGLGAALADLTGDLGLELDDQNGAPAGALIVSTTDPTATRQFLDTSLPPLISNLLDLAELGAPSCSQALGGGIECAPEGGAGATLSHDTYQGADISELAISNSGVTLAWTVVDGEAIIATSPSEVKAIIATSQGAPSLAQSAGYAQTAGSQPSVAVGYIDMSQLSTLIEQILGPANQSSFDTNVLPNLRPISSISVTATNTSGETADHILIQVP